jgi:hypothetical protein
VYVLPAELPVVFLGRTWIARELKIDALDTRDGNLTVTWYTQQLLGSLLTAIARTDSEIPLITAEAKLFDFKYSWVFENVTVQSIQTSAEYGWLRTVLSAKRIGCTTTLEGL